jgi:hypothetical protein
MFSDRCVRAAAVLLVVVLCGSGCWWGHAPDREGNTRSEAQALCSATQMYLFENPESACPSVRVLQQGGFLDPAKDALDGWGRPFVITCAGDHIDVRSRGSDGAPNTVDDISTTR